ncbi:MAG TPA: class I SAM-dependent methyltransferase, partial [Ferruginibacter sp.]|nr:class I SAM-dependent methyltransferase [Ferruginibacter sp.]
KFIRSIKDSILKKIHKSVYQPGHYYSPIPSVNELRKDWDHIFNQDIKDIKDIDLNEKGQCDLIEKFTQYHNELPYTTKQSQGLRYYSNNGFFIKGDACVLYSIIREFRPKKIIEVGSGFSSAVCLDVNELFFQNTIDLTFIEPYPDRLLSLLTETDKQKIHLLEKRIQEVPIDVFKELNENDILFIDSSHISKIGSDLNYLFFKVFPHLKKGVIIHIHDICFPFEYPSSWIENGIFWNEAYLLRAFLMNNKAYKILFWNDFIHKFHTPLLKEKLPEFTDIGGSIWLQKTFDTLEK